MKRSEDCIFCKIVAGEVPGIKIYEDDIALAIMDIMPINKGHLLVIPKEHFGTITEIDPDLYGHLNAVVCKLSRAVQAALEPDGMNVQQLNGTAANQLVPHLHIHLVPRWHGDGVTISWWEAEMGDAEKIKAHAEVIISKLAM
jgi:histidine triad (HIT) family protein